MIFVTGPLFAGKEEYIKKALKLTDEGQRQSREVAGRLACLLAQRADTVVPVCCGLPQVLKGKL